ncbi:hypothetical protein ASPCAL00789 [Aspergillus calidoustus]|uniref:Nanos-type domain-containing protein n=1 Tax=Aspergillus calidoustus TaxID=454130 RepID=A0A0U5FNW6_ASPCI|nr:hypothetical protein ASPCAL00789 [Aspergillus calidoustus]
MGIPMYGDGDEDRENGDDHKKPPAESPNTLVTENGRPLHCAFCRRPGHVVTVCPYARHYNRAAAAVETERRRRFHSMALACWLSEGYMGRGATNSLAQAPSRQDENEPNGHNSSSRQ